MFHLLEWNYGSEVTSLSNQVFHQRPRPWGSTTTSLNFYTSQEGLQWPLLLAFHQPLWLPLSTTLNSIRTASTTQPPNQLLQLQILSQVQQHQHHFSHQVRRTQLTHFMFADFTPSYFFRYACLFKARCLFFPKIFKFPQAIIDNQFLLPDSFNGDKCRHIKLQSTSRW